MRERGEGRVSARMRMLFLSRKKDMRKEEWGVNERIKEGGNKCRSGSIYFHKASRKEKELACLDCHSWPAASALRKTKGQRSPLNDVVLLVRMFGSTEHGRLSSLRCWLRQTHRDQQLHLHTAAEDEACVIDLGRGAAVLLLSQHLFQWFPFSVTCAFTMERSQMELW